MIAFWPLSEVTSLDPHDMLPKQVGSPSSYFMFADFLIHSHVYAIRLTTDPNAPCPVIFYGDMPYVYKLGDSFSDFTTLYLNNPDHVLSPPESLYFRM